MALPYRLGRWAWVRAEMASIQFYSGAYFHNCIIDIYYLGINILNVGVLPKRREDEMLQSGEQKNSKCYQEQKELPWREAASAGPPSPRRHHQRAFPPPHTRCGTDSTCLGDACSSSIAGLIPFNIFNSGQNCKVKPIQCILHKIKGEKELAGQPPHCS